MTGVKLMREIFDRYRKAIITGGGVIVFLLAGLLTMLLTDSGNEPDIRGNDKPSQPSQNQPSSPQPPTQESPKTSRTVYAYITGEVMKPGVYKLSDDARIFQLVDMAGGFTSKADKESLNLAEILADGVHVHIGTKSQATHGQSPTIPGMPARESSQVVRVTAMNSPASGLVNINTATATELESLHGIGPAIAKRIIDYRQSHGNFARPEDLVNVRGIGQSKLAQVLPHITATSSASSVTQSQSPAGKIDINRASAKELEALPGVGPATAKRIIDYRNTNGHFNSPEDLTNIRGIGWSKLEKIKAHIVIR